MEDFLKKPWIRVSWEIFQCIPVISEEIPEGIFEGYSGETRVLVSSWIFREFSWETPGEGQRIISEKNLESISGGFPRKFLKEIYIYWNAFQRDTWRNVWSYCRWKFLGNAARIFFFFNSEKMIDPERIPEGICGSVPRGNFFL